MDITITTRERNDYLDFLKGIACILLIINHFHHYGIAGQVEYTLSQ